MLQLLRTDASNVDFQALVVELDKELKIRDGEDHDFYHQFNKIEALNHVVLVYDQNTAVACGAFKSYEEDTMEIKRMYVPPEQRGKGYASMVLHELEKWCKELNVKRCILETGCMQPEAIGLYKKLNYRVIPNYGQYEGVENSVCFEKIIH